MYYFLFSPNNSGTTVMSQTVATSCGGYLPPYGNHEGQMHPKVKAMMRADPWSDRPVDYDFVRTVWDQLLQESGKQIFVEASPSNMMRVEAVLQAFPEHRAVFSMCSPWQQIASELKNYHYPPVSTRLEELTRRWMMKARRQVRNRDRFPDVPYITYEEFCRDPSMVSRAFGVPHQAAAVQGKVNSEIRGVRDLSIKTRAFLTLYEADRISGILSEESGVLNALGYDVEDLEMLGSRYAADPGQVHAGGIDRARWETVLEPTPLRLWAAKVHLKFRRRFGPLRSRFLR